MAIELPFAVTDPSNLTKLPPYWANNLFNREEVLSWYTMDEAYLTHETLFSVDRLPGIADRSPNGQDLAQTAASSFVFGPSASDLNDNSYANSNASTLHYPWPGTWPTGDHSKIFLFKAATPTANRYLAGAGSGEGAHLVYITTLDRIAAGVDGSTIVRTRDPSKWNLVITSWDATGHISAMSVDQLGFSTVAAVGTADCGAVAPEIGTLAAGTTGATAFYREIGFLNVALHKAANAELLELIQGYFISYYGLVLAP